MVLEQGDGGGGVWRGVEGCGEERKKVSAWWAQGKQIRGEENVVGREEHKMKGRSEEINLTQTSS